MSQKGSQKAASYDSPARLEQLKELTDKLIEFGGRYSRAEGANRFFVLNALSDLASERERSLVSMIETDPGKALSVAIGPEVRSGFPFSVQAHIEEWSEFEGEVEVIFEDGFESSRTLYFIQAGQERFSLHFAAGQPLLGAGSRIRVRGFRAGQNVLVPSRDAYTTLLSASAPPTFGEQRVLVILFNFQDNPVQPYTAQYAHDVVFRTVSDFFYENSYHQTWLAGEVYGWYTVPYNTPADCSLNAAVDYARSRAAADGADLASYRKFIYAFPSASCSFLGLTWTSCSGSDCTSQIYIKGGFALKVVGHELGHALGLAHSNALECGSAAIGSNCSLVGYGDVLDIMGKPNAGHFNAVQKWQLGWLGYGASPAVTAVETSGTYWLEPYESTSGGPKAIKILINRDLVTGDSTWYYLEYRQAIGFDSFVAGNSNVTGGVLIHKGIENPSSLGSVLYPPTSYLLDLTPETTSWYDPALGVGRSFNDGAVGVTITPVSLSSSGVTVSVTFNGASDSTPPTASITSPAPGSTLSGAATVEVSALDDVGVASVSLSVDGALLETRTAAPYTFSWNTTSVGDGPHTLTAAVRDFAGNTATPSISVEVGNGGDTTNPTIAIVSPADGARVTGNVSIYVNATDDVGVVKVELYVDGILKTTSASPPFTMKWNTRKAKAGAHSLQSKAYDAAGNPGTSAVITVFK